MDENLVCGADKANEGPSGGGRARGASGRRTEATRVILGHRFAAAFRILSYLSVCLSVCHVVRTRRPRLLLEPTAPLGSDIYLSIYLSIYLYPLGSGLEASFW